ncbi:phenylalanine--tRNA ligase subunit beta [Synechococcales cyanobacterium CNB]|nr:phenylalanine--tRNA ligase subunit beta [Synechococcales cyanobacterium CNB]
MRGSVGHAGAGPQRGWAILCPMELSIRWLNRYLEPAHAAADEVEHALTNAGFPIESRRATPAGDTVLDVEITSNRGDCLSQVGLAREVAAVTGRRLVMPTWVEPRRGEPADGYLSLENRVPEACPRFTAQVIRGVKIGPSPAWMTDLLESLGQRPINNVVDVTNFLTFELGHPSHVFDLRSLAGGRLIIRWAKEGEKLSTLDGKDRTLRADELVVADAERAQSLAGVIGGAESEVGASTTDVVLEVATWEPAVVRRAARRLGIRTDASHRFERGVAPAELDFAARRAAALIVEVAGGMLCSGMLDEGRPLPPARSIRFRPSRARALIGVDVPDAEQARLLKSIGIEAEGGGDALTCVPPPFRLDLEREVDLVEEVARLHGLDSVPVRDWMPVAVRPPQQRERALREMHAALEGLGFYEAVTFTFVSEDDAAPFMPPGLRMVRVDDERRKAEPVCRPSALPSLLGCRRANRAAQVARPGGVRLYEWSANFAEIDGPGARTVENRNLALLMDVPTAGSKATHEELQAGLRAIRGVVETIAARLGGEGAAVRLAASSPYAAAFRADAFADVLIHGERIGSVGLLADAVLRQHDLDHPIAAGDLNLESLLGLFPPRASIRPLPAFPPIDRDLSLLVPERMPWDRVRSLVEGANLPLLESVEFVGTYRGKQAGAGRKSVTLRLTFRDPARTLRREEVEPQVSGLIDRARAELGAELRA